jgi:hypothetical protein
MEIGDLVRPFKFSDDEIPFNWPFVSDDEKNLYTRVMIVSLSPLAVASTDFEKIWVISNSISIKVEYHCSNLLTIAGCLAVWEKYKQENKDAVEKNFGL